MSDLDDIMSEYDDQIDAAIEDARGIHEAVELMEKDKQESSSAESAPGATLSTDASFLDESSAMATEAPAPPPPQRPQSQPQPRRAPQAQPSIAQAPQTSVLTVLLPYSRTPYAIEIVELRTGRIVVSKVIPPMRPQPGRPRVLRFRVRRGAYISRVIEVKKSMKFSIQAQAGKIDLR